MNVKDFFRILGKAGRDWALNPSIFIFPLLLLGVLTTLSYLATFVAPHLTTSVANLLWLVVYGLISLFVIGYALAGLIGVAHAITRNEKNQLREGLRAARASGLRNSGAIVLLVAAYNLVLWISYFLAFSAGKLLSLEVSTAQILFIFLFFIGVVSFLLFFAFTNFFVVMNRQTMRGGISHSIRLVRREYLATLSMSILFLILGQLIELVTGTTSVLFKELINTLILYPYLALVITRFIVHHDIHSRR